MSTASLRRRSRAFAAEFPSLLPDDDTTEAERELAAERAIRRAVERLSAVPDDWVRVLECRHGFTWSQVALLLVLVLVFGFALGVTTSVHTAAGMW